MLLKIIVFPACAGIEDAHGREDHSVAPLGGTSMAISDADVKRANARMQARLKAGPKASSARYDRCMGRVVVSLGDGLELAFPANLVEGLGHATADDLTNIEITPSGLGLHFPKLDADLYLPSLLDGLFGLDALVNMATAAGLHIEMRVLEAD